MINENTLTITLASNEYGFGHFKRMLNFKKKLTNYNYKNYLTHFHGDSLFFVKKKISITYLSKFIKKKQIFFIVLDLSNPKFLKKKIFLEIVKILSNLKIPLIIFDDFSKQIYKNLKFFSKFIIVCPYIYDNKFIKNKRKKYPNLFVGTKYAVLQKNEKFKKKNLKLKKVLISCGGTDFKKLTLKLIQILKKNSYLKICAIIGPHFDKSEKSKILSLENKNIKIMSNVDNISKVAKNYDLGIITSGLTKYELLSIRMRFAVISENKEFFRFHYPFSRKKLCYDLGYFKNFKLLEAKINNLIYNFKNFDQLVKFKSIDTNGSDRLIKIAQRKFI